MRHTTCRRCDRTLGKGVDAHRAEKCPDAAIFDNKSNMDADALASLIMTVSIVVILGIGMGLIASDLQVGLLRRIIIKRHHPLRVV